MSNFFSVDICVSSSELKSIVSDSSHHCYSHVNCIIFPIDCLMACERDRNEIECSKSIHEGDPYSSLLRAKQLCNKNFEAWI